MTWSPFWQWASARGIPVIEDCCLAFGSRYKGQLCGTFGIASYFSGQWNKPFSTGLGGMLVVNEEDLAAPGAGAHRRRDD
ncbi:MAG: DegT/DnrJ/EryC1/StrS family aminotransferase [bacterium]